MEKEEREKRREDRNGGHLEPSVDTLLVEVMVTGSEGSYLLSSLELTHTHHTTEGGREGGRERGGNQQDRAFPKPHKKDTLNSSSLYKAHFRSVPYHTVCASLNKVCSK